MNGTVSINKEDTLKILKRQIEARYECGSCNVDAKVSSGCYDPRDLGGYSDEVSFTFKFQKDLGLGIGDSTIEVSISDSEARKLLGNLLTETGIENTDITFKTATGNTGCYQDSEKRVFDGVTVRLKEIRDTFTPRPPKMITGI